ncbi:MAG: hypothetical protein P8M68_00440 [Aquiluna sp.]|nr:hypothetical protein [Aquiluna sp.]
MSDPKNAKRSRGHTTSIPKGHSLGEFRTHGEATEFVNRLVAGEFKANKISIIGHDLVLVESVRTRLGYGRVALSGAITGFWLGLIFALLVGAGIETSADGSISYAPQEFIAVLVMAAGGGMLLNILRFVATKNKRGFISSQMPVAARYEVIVPEQDVVEARKALKLTGTAE